MLEVGEQVLVVWGATDEGVWVWEDDDMARVLHVDQVGGRVTARLALAERVVVLTRPGEGWAWVPAQDPGMGDWDGAQEARIFREVA